MLRVNLLLAIANLALNAALHERVLQNVLPALTVTTT
jgi:hypothetical protein